MAEFFEVLLRHFLEDAVLEPGQTELLGLLVLLVLFLELLDLKGGNLCDDCLLVAKVSLRYLGYHDFFSYRIFFLSQPVRSRSSASSADG